MSNTQTRTPLLATLHEHDESQELFANITEEAGFPSTMPWEPEVASSPSESFIPTNILGSESFISRIQAVCAKFPRVWNTQLNPMPADIPPMELHVDEDKWKVPKNRGPPRPQSTAKQEEIRKQVNSMLEAGVIRPSMASEVSQVHMTPKPNNGWRFCLDFRNLNDVTSGRN
jgi:hypothetical protein